MEMEKDYVWVKRPTLVGGLLRLLLLYLGITLEKELKYVHVLPRYFHLVYPASIVLGYNEGRQKHPLLS